MQKKIIALAIAAAVSAPAFADNSNVTIYGVANVSYDMTNNGVVGTNKVSSNVSRLGLKGSEDLGDGLSAVWQVEQLVTIDNSGAAGNGLATRNTFAGLSSGSMGTFILGRHDTPYKIASRGFDVFGDTIADNRSLMGGASYVSNIATPAVNAVAASSAAASFDGRQGDVVAYISPAMSGFTGAIAYVAGAEGANVAGASKGSAWSLAGLYGNGPLNINAAYEVHNIGSAPGTLGNAALPSVKESAWKLGAGYTMDALTVNAVYERTSDNFGGQAALGTGALAAGADTFGHNSWYLSGKYSFGNDAVKLAYTKMGNMNAALGVDTGAKQVSLGYDHNLSKRTALYALYTKLSNGTNAAFGFTTAGSTGGMTAGVAGAGVSAWSLGMKHTF